MSTTTAADDAAPGDAPQPGADDGGLSGDGRYPWIAMAIILGGSYMFVIDTTVLGVALPNISSDLQASDSIGIDWLISAYLMAIGMVQPASGWLADRFGRKNTYLGSLLLFVLGSVAAGLAPTFPILVAARVLQGLGGGAMQPIGMAMIYSMFPPGKRGTALGVWGVAIMAAPALGPPLGGWVTTAASWRWIFLINLPIGLLVFFFGARLLRPEVAKRETSLHWQAWLSAATGLIALVVVSRQASEWGPLAPRTLLLFLVSFVLLGHTVTSSLRQDQPLLEFRVFKERTFALCMLVMGLVTITQFGRLTFLPAELQFVYGLDPAEVGLIMFPSAFSVAATMPLGGWLADRIGARWPLFVSLLITSSTTWLLGTLTPDDSTQYITAILVASGFGTGLGITSNTTAAMNSLPSQFVDHATALRSVSRQIFGAIGTAVLAALLVQTLGAVSPDGLDVMPPPGELQAAYNLVFQVCAVILAAGAVLALFLPGRATALEHLAMRAREAEDEAAALQEYDPL